MGYQHEWDAALESLRAMHKRGIRILPGGDYGFAFTPHCQNARDLEFFVKYLGFTPMEAIRSATLYGGQIMMKPDELGAIKDGYLADLLLVDGDPLANLVDPARPEAHPRGDEGRRVRQVARDRARSGAGSAPHEPSGKTIALWLAVRRAGRRSFVGLGDRRQRARCSSRRCSTALTLASLYFLVASGFTLVFGLMRNVNLAHGSLYLLGAYVGWIVGEHTGSWLLAVAAGLPRRGAGRAC